MSTKDIDWKDLEKRVYMNTFTRQPLTLVRGKGVKAWDDKGKEYLDFVGGLAVNSLGHCHPVVTRALYKQANKLIQTSNLYYTQPQLKLAELLVRMSCLDRVFICNSGAEANEGAFKLARRYGKLKLNGAYEIITTSDSFHGRTLATTAATGQNKFQEPYIPMPDGFVNVPYNNIEALKAATTSKTCAVMLEPIQGEGGVNLPDDDYLQKVHAWCSEKGLLFMLDEVQTGIGRTGKLFAYEHYGVEPDVMTLAKGMGGGVPVGALLAKEHASVFQPGEHGSTFGGNPLICAVAYEVLKYIVEKEIPKKASMAGWLLKDKLLKLTGKYSEITGVRGKGLLVAVGLQTDIAETLVAKCMERGLLINNVKPNALRFIPPLIVTERDIAKAVTILDHVLAERS